ncbi:MAG: alpha/beta hydrolase [Coriobacteriales bacterium]|nr:alpha/beta hydrolase [Coriobacteriales bacterium]
MDVVAYIHGKGGCAAEAKHYKQLFASRDVIGLAYEGATPWDAGKEIHETIATLKEKYDSITLVANSIGAYFSMNADVEKYVTHAYFISPIVDMEKLITNMMGWAGVTEPELQERGSVRTDFGEDLSWEYLCFARQHPVDWSVPTDILYGSKDTLTSLDTITAFARGHHAHLTILDGGEHWFHTQEQMRILDTWIRNRPDRFTQT